MAAAQPRFIFRGNAMPFGGRILREGNTQKLAMIPGPPAAALAVTGGHSRAVGGASSPHEAFSWDATLAEAKGELLASGEYLTTVTSSITKVRAKNAPHVFEADLLSVTMVSSHASLKPASIVLKEAVFSGLRLGGDPITVEADNDLNSAPTMDAFEERYQSNRLFFQRHQDPSRPGSVAFGDPIPRTSGGYAITSIVNRIRWRNQTHEGHILTFPGFGTIFFGEVLMNENNRRLTMVRLQMGSAVRADVAYAEADPNGTWGT